MPFFTSFSGKSLSPAGLRLARLFEFTKTISSNTQEYNLRTDLLANGWDEFSPVNATITINTGVYVWSNVTSTAALTVTNLPSKSVISIVNNGYIMGMGGAGSLSGNGSPGGDAIESDRNISVTNNASGVIAGGGGGGAGGQVTYSSTTYRAGGGGGAGGGFGGSGAFPTRTYAGTTYNLSHGGTIGNTGEYGGQLQIDDTGGQTPGEWYVVTTGYVASGKSTHAGGAGGGRVIGNSVADGEYRNAEGYQTSFGPDSDPGAGGANQGGPGGLVHFQSTGGTTALWSTIVRSGSGGGANNALDGDITDTNDAGRNAMGQTYSGIIAAGGGGGNFGQTGGNSIAQQTVGQSGSSSDQVVVTSYYAYGGAAGKAINNTGTTFLSGSGTYYGATS